MGVQKYDDHYGAIVIIGEADEGVAYIVDGVAEQYKHIDWWTERAKEFIAEYGNIKFYCDTARSEHIADFKRNGINAIFANKSVIAGIEEVAKRFKENRLFYVKDTVPRFEDEIYQYRWKANSTKDEPLKEYDDVLDSVRYALYTQHLDDEKHANRDYKTTAKKARRLF